MKALCHERCYLSPTGTIVQRWWNIFLESEHRFYTPIVLLVHHGQLQQTRFLWGSCFLCLLTRCWSQAAVKWMLRSKNAASPGAPLQTHTHTPTMKYALVEGCFYFWPPATDPGFRCLFRSFSCKGNNNLQTCPRQDPSLISHRDWIVVGKVGRTGLKCPTQAPV